MFLGQWGTVRIYRVGKRTLRVLLHDIAFKCGKFGSRWECWLRHAFCFWIELIFSLFIAQYWEGLVSYRSTWRLKLIISMYFMCGSYINISTLVSYFWLFCRQQLFDHPPHCCQSYQLLRCYFKNLNLEVRHDVVFLNETCVRKWHWIQNVAWWH